MHRWKNELKEAFHAPQPVRKSEFLRQLNCPETPVHMFLMSQVGYIRKWVWCVSAVILIASVLSVAFLPSTSLWMISGLTPFLALTIVSESGRSQRYQMVELEMATRFSLRSVTLARLVILGLANLLILSLLLVMGVWNGTSAPLAAILYIATPFLLTSFTGLLIVRNIRGQEAIYAAAGVSLGISVFLFRAPQIIYQEQYLSVWLIAALVLVLGNGAQYAAMVKQTEEFVWN